MSPNQLFLIEFRGRRLGALTQGEVWLQLIPSSNRTVKLWSPQGVTSWCKVLHDKVWALKNPTKQPTPHNFLRNGLKHLRSGFSPSGRFFFFPPFERDWGGGNFSAPRRGYLSLLSESGGVRGGGPKTKNVEPFPKPQICLSLLPRAISVQQIKRAHKTWR